MFGSLRQRGRRALARLRGVQIADDCRIMNEVSFGSEPYLVSIGRHVTIRGRVSFVTHDGATWILRRLPQYATAVKYGRITIRDNCFIGFGSVILPGVSIGPNSVVAANSLVTRDVPPDTIAGGSPARPLMTAEEYGEKVLSGQPDYDPTAYRRDKKRELLRLFPYPW